MFVNILLGLFLILSNDLSWLELINLSVYVSKMYLWMRNCSKWLVMGERKLFDVNNFFVGFLYFVIFCIFVLFL